MTRRPPVLCAVVLIVMVALSPVLAACDGSAAPAAPSGSPSGAPSGSPPASPSATGSAGALPSLVQDLLSGASVIWTRDGVPAAQDEVSVRNGPQHCDWQTVLFLDVVPLDGSASQATGALQFVRDASGHQSFEASVAGTLDLDAALPPDAAFSGYATRGVALWFADSAPDSAFLTDGTHVEAWPRATRPIGCA